MGDAERMRLIEAAMDLAHRASLIEQAIRLGLPERAQALIEDAKAYLEVLDAA